MKLPYLLIGLILSFSQSVYADDKHMETGSQLLNFCVEAMKKNVMEYPVGDTDIGIVMTRNNTVAQFGEFQDSIHMISAIDTNKNEARCSLYMPDPVMVMLLSEKVLNQDAGFKRQDAPIGMDGVSFLYDHCNVNYIIEILTNPNVLPDHKKGAGAYKLMGMGTEVSLHRFPNKKGQC